MCKFDRPMSPAHEGSQYAKFPIPSLAHNVSVERVHARLFIPSTEFVFWVHEMLLLFLSNITSPRIEQISIEFFLPRNLWGLFTPHIRQVAAAYGAQMAPESCWQQHPGAPPYAMPK